MDVTGHDRNVLSSTDITNWISSSSTATQQNITSSCFKINKNFRSIGGNPFTEVSGKCHSPEICAHSGNTDDSEGSGSSESDFGASSSDYYEDSDSEDSESEGSTVSSGQLEQSLL